MKDLYDWISAFTGIEEPAVVMLLTVMVIGQFLNYRTSKKLGDIVTEWDKAFHVHRETTDLRLNNMKEDINTHTERLNRHSVRLDDHHDFIIRLTEKTDHK